MSDTENNKYNAIAGSKYFNKFCKSLGMTINEMEIIRVLLNNQDEYITHNEELEEYTGLSQQQIKDAIARLKTRRYIKITTTQVGMKKERKTDLWDFVEAFDEFVTSINNERPEEKKQVKKVVVEEYTSTKKQTKAAETEEDLWNLLTAV